MTNRISIRPSVLEEQARYLDSLGEQIRQLGSTLDQALRPVRRSDVPELGAIDGTYGPLRARMSRTGTLLGGQARLLRGYTARVRQLEASVLVRARLKLMFGTTAAQRRPGVASYLVGPTLGIFGQVYASITGKQLLGFDADGLPTGVLSGKLFAINRVLGPLGIGLDLRTVLDRNAAVTDRAGSGVGLGVVATESLGAYLVRRKAAIGTKLVKVGRVGGLFGLAAGVGSEVGNYNRDQFDHDREVGVSSLGRIWGGRSPFAMPGARDVVRLGQTGLLGVYEGARALGNIGVDEYVPADHIGNEAVAVILAELRREHPKATVQQFDGVFQITIPDPATGYVDRFQFANDTWKRR